MKKRFRATQTEADLALKFAEDVRRTAIHFAEMCDVANVSSGRALVLMVGVVLDLLDYLSRDFRKEFRKPVDKLVGEYIKLVRGPIAPSGNRPK
jgi:hypothetical protein